MMSPRLRTLFTLVTSFCVCTLYIQNVCGLTYFTRDDLFKKYKTFTRVSAANKTSFTQEEKDLILNISNAYRSVVYPPAFEMRELTWDLDLEEYARNHTQKCTGAHSAATMVKKINVNDPNTWVTWSLMGEVLYYNYGGVYSIEEAFYLFWEEGSKYDIGTNNCTHSNTCGHYKVLTTDHSSKIGCALNICNSFTISKYPVPATFLMCSYDGMFLSDDRPYTVGVQCAGCTSSRLGYFFQYCRNRICIGPNLRFLNLGFNGSTLVIGFDYNDIIVVDDSISTSTVALTTTTLKTVITETSMTTLLTTSAAPGITKTTQILDTTLETIETVSTPQSTSSNTISSRTSIPFTSTTTPATTLSTTSTTTSSTSTTPSSTSTTPPSTSTTPSSTSTTLPSTSTTPSTTSTTQSTTTTTPSTTLTTQSTTRTTLSTTSTTQSTTRTTLSTTSTTQSTTTTTPSTTSTTPSTTSTTASTTSTTASTTSTKSPPTQSTTDSTTPATSTTTWTTKSTTSLTTATTSLTTATTSLTTATTSNTTEFIPYTTSTSDLTTTTSPKTVPSTLKPTTVTGKRTVSRATSTVSISKSFHYVERFTEIIVDLLRIKCWDKSQKARGVWERMRRPDRTSPWWRLSRPEQAIIAQCRTGHCPVGSYFSCLWPNFDSRYPRCGEEEETVPHILFDCHRLADLRLDRSEKPKILDLYGELYALRKTAGFLSRAFTREDLSLSSPHSNGVS